MATMVALMRSSKLLGRLARERCTAEDAAKFVGSYRSVHMIYATDEKFRKEGASGTKAILVHNQLIEHLMAVAESVSRNLPRIQSRTGGQLNRVIEDIA